MLRFFRILASERKAGGESQRGPLQLFYLDKPFRRGFLLYLSTQQRGKQNDVARCRGIVTREFI